MIKMRKTRLGTLVVGVLAVSGLTGCESNTPQDEAVANEVAATEWTTQSLPGEWAYPLDQQLWLTVGENSGIQISGHGQIQESWDVAAEYLDYRDEPEGRLFASFDSEAGQPLFFTVGQGRLDPIALTDGARIDEPVEGLCLYRDSDEDLYLFILSELHRAHQYLVRRSEAGITLHAVRSLPIPPESVDCAVDDYSGTLYVAESGVGVWAYGAEPEAVIERRPVAMATPFGDLTDGPSSVAAAPGQLLILAGEQLHLRSGESRTMTIGDAGAPETLTARWDENAVQAAIFDEDAGAYRTAALALEPSAISRTGRVPTVSPLVETAPVPSQGDAADDPAIWINVSAPSRSLVLGTNKRQGLHVYDLAGREVQSLPVGRLNNVDVRYGIDYRGQTADIAVATNRTRNSLSLFAIDRNDGKVIPVTELTTDLPEIYGLCLYQPDADHLYAFANDKSGRYVQYRLDLAGDRWRGEPVREFSIGGQPEGCVADDRRGRLFVGEEDHGIWVVDAEPDSGNTLTPLDEIGERLHDDVEGLSLYGGEYLVVSSQGNNSYVLYDAAPPYAPVGIFRIGANHEAMIDGASETDGLTVTSSNLGEPWAEGLLVVQDGRNVLPAQEQNFKLVPWRAVRETLELPTHD